MSDAVKLMVDAHVSLKDRVALEEMREHRQRLRRNIQQKAGGWVDVESVNSNFRRGPCEVVKQRIEPRVLADRLPELRLKIERTRDHSICGPRFPFGSKAGHQPSKR